MRPSRVDLDEMRGHRGIEMAQCMSLFLQMDRDKARQLDAKAFHEAVRKLRLSGQALLSVQEVLDEAKE